MTVDSDVVGRIGSGVCLLVGIEEGDGEADVQAAVDKILNLRIFPDGEDRMNRSIAEAGGAIMLVSQFTLVGSVRKGRRPSFTRAADPRVAQALIVSMTNAFETAGVDVAEGEFGASMTVDISNHGPVTFVLDVKEGVVS